MDFSTRYKKLNIKQQQAVDTTEGPVMVVAGPGTGKTELLSMRAANILRTTDTLPQNILCLTFTESGAEAMRRRMVAIIGKDAHKIAIHTFHSFGAEIINQNNEFFYSGAAFQPASELNSYEILRTIFDELPQSSPLKSKMNGEYTHLRDTLTVISELKKSGLLYDELLSTLDANQAAINHCEPLIKEALGARISKASVGALQAIIPALQEAAIPLAIPNLSPLASLLSHDLETALLEAETTGKTTPVTAWKNKWLTKDAAGELILKARKTEQKLRDVAHIYEGYLIAMRERSLYDFDDMILRVVHALDTFPELRYNLQEKFQYIMVDEFQDTNLAQMRILHTLTHSELIETPPNIMVVGDDDQGIYSFQGAEISNIINFHHMYPSVTTITLTDNYRSSEPILQAARAVITQNSDRLETLLEGIDKQLTAHQKPEHSSAVELYEASSRWQERHHIAQQIAHRIANGQPAESIAVLARQHHELVSLLPHFAKAGIAVNYERRDNVLDLEPIVAIEMLARTILALHQNQHNEVNALLPELLAHPAFKLPPQAIWKLSLSAYNEHRSWMETMEVTPEFEPLHAWLITLSTLSPYTPIEMMLDYLIGKTTPNDDGFTAPFMEYYFGADTLSAQPDDYLRYLEGLRTIRDKLREYTPDTPLFLADLMRFISLHRQLGTTMTSSRPASEQGEGAIHLMTAHKSKGLEFDTVYVINASETTWGEKVRARSRNITYPENLPLAPSGEAPSERLRLFFVAMTRAKQQLIISYATADDATKPLHMAGFLLTAQLPVTLIPEQTTTQEEIEAAEDRWYAPLISLPANTMQTLLTPTLEKYKLSITHLNNFLDVSRGGPQTFLMNNLLRFPQAMGPTAAYGSAIHAALQRAHAHYSATGEHLSTEETIADFIKNLEGHHLTTEDMTQYSEKGKATLTAFLDYARPSFTRHQKVELNFAGQQVFIGAAHLTGALDLTDINKSEKSLIITDYKTGKPAYGWTGRTDYEKIKLHKYRQQLMFYELLTTRSRDYHAYRVEVGRLQFVEPSQTGDILHLEASFTSDELERFTRLIEAVWQKITTLDLPDASSYSPDYKGMLAFEADLLGE